MARNFGTSSDNWYLQVVGVPVTGVPLTMFARWYRTDDTVYQDLLAIYQHGTNHNFKIGGRLAGQGYARARDNVATGDALSSGTPIGLNEWHSVCGVFRSSASRFCYVDGVPGDENTTEVTPADLNRTTIGAHCDNYRLLSGREAEAAVWNTNLPASAIGELAAGMSPLGVLPQYLAFYVSLVRDDDKDVVGGLSLTAYGSPTVVAHPRVIYPYPPSYTMGAGAPPTGKLLTRMQTEGLFVGQAA